MSNSVWLHGLQPTKLSCPWDSPGKKTGVGCHSLLQRIFPTKESNPSILNWRQILYHLSHQWSLQYIYIYIYLIYGKAMVFPVVMYGCERWTVKKAEHRKIGAFELWCWRRLLRVPWTARRSSQSILKDINPGCSLEGLMLKLKLQYFGHLTRRADSLEKTLMLGETGGRRRRGQQRMRWLDGHWLDGHEFE